jgi:hypothetical protein
MAGKDAMLWTVIWGVLAAGAALRFAAHVQGLRFERRVKEEARALLAAARTPDVPAPLDPLPAPVRRYLEVSGAARHPPVRAVRLRHVGTFAPKAGAPSLPIRGEQYFAADPPAFVWWGRIRMAPGLWIDGRDRAVAGEGSMLVKAASTFTIADARGPALDQGALLRLLGELTWMPTALADPRYVRWSALDGASARATLCVGGREVSATFHFGPDGLPVRFAAERYRDVGGRSVLTPFSGETGDYREVEGILMPFRVTAIWHVDGRPMPYARWEIERIELDPPGPF